MIEADELINVILPFVGRKKQIGLTTRLYQDLRIMGDDADELFISIMERFGTSFAGINLSAYFPEEYAAGYLYLASLFGMPDRKHASFTGQHLPDVVHN